jgi:hypothetical protein
METDRMTLRYVFHKPFKVHLSNKQEWQNGFNPDNIRHLVWHTDGSKTNKCTGAGMYKWGSRKGHSFSLGHHPTVYQAEIYAIKACIMENTEKGYKGRNIIFSLTVKQQSRRLITSRSILTSLGLPSIPCETGRT